MIRYNTNKGKIKPRNTSVFTRSINKTIQLGTVCSTTERIRSSIVKIPNTYIEAIKSDFADY
jgi:hypothetical protein